MVTKKKPESYEYEMYTITWIEPLLREEITKKFDDLGEAQKYLYWIHREHKVYPKISVKTVKVDL